MAHDGMSIEEQRARGIAAMGRVARDDDGFTVYATAPAPDAFRVWEDPHAGLRCTCERFYREFAVGAEYRCEHILAVGFALEPPGDEVAPIERRDAPQQDATLRRVV